MKACWRPGHDRTGQTDIRGSVWERNQRRKGTVRGSLDETEPRLVRPTSIYDLDGVGATSEPGVSRVPDPAAELLKNRLLQRIPSSTAMYWRTLVSSAGSALE